MLILIIQQKVMMKRLIMRRRSLKKNLLRNNNILGSFVLTSVTWLFALPATPLKGQVEVWSFKGPSLTINNIQFQEVLDSLITLERECSHFDNSFVWVIKTAKDTNELSTIKIHYSVGYPVPYGFFYRDNILFFVTGDTLDGLFNFTDSVAEFRHEYNPRVMKSPAADYSSWVYYYRNCKLTLKWDFAMKCHEKE